MQETGKRLSNVRHKNRRRISIVLLCASLLFLVLFLRIWFSSKAVELACEINLLAAEKETLGEDKKKISLEIAKLRSPERITRIATRDLKMIRSSDAEVIELEK